MSDHVFCHCAHCGTRTGQRVFKERVLAPVYWCMRCFNLVPQADEAAKGAPMAGLVRPATTAGDAAAGEAV